MTPPPTIPTRGAGLTPRAPAWRRRRGRGAVTAVSMCSDGQRRDRRRLDAADEVRGHQAAVGEHGRLEAHLRDAGAPAPVVDGRHLGHRRAGVEELQQQLDVGGEARLAHQQVAVGLGGAPERPGAVDAVQGGERVHLLEPAEVAEGVRDRLGGREPPAGHADDLPARRVDRGEHDVVALVEALEHGRQVVEVRGVVGLERHDRVVVLGLAERGAQPGVDRRAEPAVDLVPHDREVEVLAVGHDRLARAVRRPVVDEDHAGPELTRPRREVLEQPRDVLGLVVGGDDESDHGRLSPGQAASVRVGALGMPSRVIGRELKAESRTASAAISARQPS